MFGELNKSFRHWATQNLQRKKCGGQKKKGIAYSPSSLFAPPSPIATSLLNTNLSFCGPCLVTLFCPPSQNTIQYIYLHFILCEVCWRRKI